MSQQPFTVTIAIYSQTSNSCNQKHLELLFLSNWCLVWSAFPGTLPKSKGWLRLKEASGGHVFPPSPQSRTFWQSNFVQVLGLKSASSIYRLHNVLPHNWNFWQTYQVKKLPRAAVAGRFQRSCPGPRRMLTKPKFSPSPNHVVPTLFRQARSFSAYSAVSTVKDSHTQI